MYKINKTKLQLLLDAIEPSEEEKDDAILEFFNSQEEEEYKIGDITYFIFDKQGVEDLIKDEWNEKAENFHIKLDPLQREFDRIINNLEYSEAVENIVYDFEYDLLEDWKFETITENEKYYIYTEY